MEDPLTFFKNTFKTLLEQLGSDNIPLSDDQMRVLGALLLRAGHQLPVSNLSPQDFTTKWKEQMGNHSKKEQEGEEEEQEEEEDEDKEILEEQPPSSSKEANIFEQGRKVNMRKAFASFTTALQKWAFDPESAKTQTLYLELPQPLPSTTINATDDGQVESGFAICHCGKLQNYVQDVLSYLSAKVGDTKSVEHIRKEKVDLILQEFMEMMVLQLALNFCRDENKQAYIPTNIAYGGDGLGSRSTVVYANSCLLSLQPKETNRVWMLFQTEMIVSANGQLVRLQFTYNDTDPDTGLCDCPGCSELKRSRDDNDNEDGHNDKRQKI
jgi:hypothetical protein